MQTMSAASSLADMMAGCPSALRAPREARYEHYEKHTIGNVSLTWAVF